MTDVVPLKKYVEKRRRHEEKSDCSWVRACGQGQIPGAFRYSERGPWFVDLDIHDEEVRKRATRQPQPVDDSIEALADALGLSEEDLQIAVAATRN